MHAHLRSRFARALIESLHASSGGMVLEQLRMKLPQRLRDILAGDVLAARDFNQTMRLDEAESLLFAIDSTLGDGSGRLLEDAATAFASRLVTEIRRRYPGADVKTLVAHLRAPLEHPFEGVTPRFDLMDTDTGFSLTVGVNGRPTTTRLLRHLATGYVRAAATRAGLPSVRIFGETVGNDRAVLSVHTRQSAELAPPPRSSRQSSPWRVAPGGTLSSEVERILGSAPTVPSFRSPAVRIPRPNGDAYSSSEHPPSGEHPRSDTPPPFDETAPNSTGRRGRR